MQKSVSIKWFLIKAMRLTMIQFVLLGLLCSAALAGKTNAQELLSKEISLSSESIEVKSI